ncbi:MAG: glycosyltransferase family 2 protein [Desulfovermiculus sp.]|nr:glycosyltransferase family 2 protein [Desulfovermiculus sp.]
MTIIFWLCIAAIFYAYFGYPFILYGLSRFRCRPVHRDEQHLPQLTLIITVHNEEDRIQDKIENTLTLDYPRDMLEVIFASDASTDRTESIVRSYPRFKLVRSQERKGKEFAQKRAVDQARGDILVFSDVATRLDSNALRTMAANFADPSVGCVSSEDRFVDSQGLVSGEGAYVQYEMFLRRLESRVCSVVGLSGSFFAARREVCGNWAVDLQSDFNTLLNAVKMGYRGVSDPQTLGYYRNIADEKKEFSRKVRTVLRGLSVLMRNLSILNVFRYGLFSWELFSHKLCRWLVPFFLLLALGSNLFLIPKSPFYVLTFFLQAVLYAAALAYGQVWLHKGSSSKAGLLPSLVRGMKIPYYFCTVNAAIFMAWMKYVRGERAIFWEPSKR